ncbi:DUF6053 domain-containing protein, partial [Lysobacter enzymogenes]|uniref:DUF6053 domain-containing protein n=1 Tax=Lysobacter enzymogenes TaxID=69 RepID=UPI003D18AFA2
MDRSRLAVSGSVFVGGASAPTLSYPIAAIWHESVGTEVPPTQFSPAAGAAAIRSRAAGTAAAAARPVARRPDATAGLARMRRAGGCARRRRR